MKKQRDADQLLLIVTRLRQLAARVMEIEDRKALATAIEEFTRLALDAVPLVAPYERTDEHRKLISLHASKARRVGDLLDTLCEQRPAAKGGPITPTQLAAQLDIPKTSLSNYRLGVTPCPHSRHRLISEALGKPLPESYWIRGVDYDR